MFYRHLLFGLLLCGNAYRIWRRIITDRQQKKPLPAEVQDIYTPEKYRDFLNREHDYLPLFIYSRIVSILTNAFFIYSPYYTWMEKLGAGNEYLIMLATILTSELVSFVFSVPRSYYATFTIEEKYGLNRMSRKSFWKDQCISVFTSLFVSAALYGFVIFIMHKLPSWTGNEPLTYGRSFLLVAAITAVSAVFIFAVSIIAYFIQRMQYSYRDLEPGELREKIMALTQGAKKKIRRIEIYDESKKSNGKNAYMLRILWYRAFGIADNYLDGNSERELLAVLAHEAGHLKHKKDILEYLEYGTVVILLILMTFLLPHAGAVTQIVNDINQSYEISANNYILLLSYGSAVLTPLSFVSGVFSNYVSRRNETEADLNAVKEGYGEELIETFKKMGSDELIDVNPAPILEFLEDDHPSIVSRIRTIRNAMMTMSGKQMASHN